MAMLIMTDAEYAALKEIRPVLEDTLNTLKMVERKRLDMVTRGFVYRSTARIQALLNAKTEGA